MLCNFISGPQQLQPEVKFTLNSLSVLGKLFRTSSLLFPFSERERGHTKSGLNRSCLYRMSLNGFYCFNLVLLRAHLKCS